MLVELRVRDLGVIADLRLVLGPGMTAVTGETGAGKTLVVEAIELLVGGRADAVLVRPGAAEAFVEGRFSGPEGEEVILARSIPAGGGRSRAYINGRMATVSALAERGVDLVDLHGQHAHQSLLFPATQRSALDAFAGIDLGPLREVRRRIAALDEELSSLGGDARTRAREVDLLAFQLEEIERASIEGPDEEHRLEAEEDVLAGAVELREAAIRSIDLMTSDGGAIDAIGAAIAALGDATAFAEETARLRGLQAEVIDLSRDLRERGEAIVDDPERLTAVRERRRFLHDLRRKYGDDLAAVLDFAATTARRLDDLRGHEARVGVLEGERRDLETRHAAVAARVADERRKAAPALAEAIEGRLRELAMPRATIAVAVEGDGPGDDVTFLLAANAGEPAQPLGKVASGGELARAMLATRLVLSGGPGTLVFDEVDAGIGGEAAVAVGRALAALGCERQVLVVTHLPQVAAFADAQVAVRKDEVGGRTIASVVALADADRVVELSRMLSGQPDSSTARNHAVELLDAAAAARGRP